MRVLRRRSLIFPMLALVFAGWLFFTADGPAETSPPFTPAPADNPNGYTTTEQLLEQMLATVAEHPLYAGAYRDAVLGVVVRATGDIEWFEQSIVPYAERNRRVRVELADYTVAELEAVAAAIDLAEWRARGVPMSASGVDLERNRVAIGVEALTPEYEAALRAAYGDMIYVHEHGPFQVLPGATTQR